MDRPGKMLIRLWIVWISAGKPVRSKCGHVDKKVENFFGRRHEKRRRRVFAAASGRVVYFRRSSPTVTISPAPMVITRSPGTHCLRINASIASKDGK